jgi:hypothetical protein
VNPGAPRPGRGHLRSQCSIRGVAEAARAELQLVLLDGPDPGAGKGVTAPARGGHRSLARRRLALECRHGCDGWRASADSQVGVNPSKAATRYSYTTVRR